MNNQKFSVLFRHRFHYVDFLVPDGYFPEHNWPDGGRRSYYDHHASDSRKHVVYRLGGSGSQAICQDLS